MISEKDFDEILKKKGLMEQCRKVWLRSFVSCQSKYNLDKDSLKNLVTAALKNGCKASCYS